MTFFSRFLQMCQRRRIAKQYGFVFKRSANFQMPDHININNNRHRLNLPDENGVKMAIIDLLLDDCYRCRELATVSTPINKVLDIGANVGLFGIAARNAFPDAQIHAYEPNPFLEKYLEVQAKSAVFSYFMEAVGLEKGTVSLEFNSDSVQTRSSNDDTGKIPLISFREALTRLGGDVDFVKMDCEGAEWDIFKDVDSWKHVRHLSMEYHLWPEHTHEEAKNAVQQLGFKIRSQLVLNGFGLIIASCT